MENGETVPPEMGSAASSLQPDVAQLRLLQHFISWAAINKGAWAALAPDLLAQGGGFALQQRIILFWRAKSHAIVAFGAAQRDQSPKHIQPHQFRLPLQRIAPAAATCCNKPDEVAFLQRFVVHQAGQLTLIGRAWYTLGKIAGG